MIRYIKNILVPYYDKQKELRGIISEQPDIALFDIFKAHPDPLFLVELDKRNIIPLSCACFLHKRAPAFGLDCKW